MRTIDWAVCVVLLWGTAYGARGAQGSRPGSRSSGLIPPYGPTLGRGMRRHLAPPRGAVSPDGRYLARVKIVEAAVGILTVLDARSRRPLGQADDVAGFVWVPGRPHRLIMAACGTYGRARLALWEGPHRWRDLRRVRHPHKECFTLYGVTRDGRAILYGYNPDVSGKGVVGRLNRRRWLRLPR
jgi:hypothetical protein